MCDTAMLNRIASKKMLITEDTKCNPYVKKKILKILSDNNDDNYNNKTSLLKQITF